MSEEKSRIETTINLTQEEVVAGLADLEDGTILKITSGADEGGEFTEQQLLLNPAVEMAILELRSQIGQVTDLPLMKLLSILCFLRYATPRVQQDFLWDTILRQGLPWQTTLVVERMRLGLPFDESAFFGQGAIPPSMNINITTPEIRLPEQAAPVVNLEPHIENHFPATEEKVSIERDANGFIQSATRVRQPID